jgi:hypothetical protein
MTLKKSMATPPGDVTVLAIVTWSLMPGAIVAGFAPVVVSRQLPAVPQAPPVDAVH